MSYDGMFEPLGQSQVLAYLRLLASDRVIHLMSFEKPGDWADLQQRNAVADSMRSAGIIWHAMRYHKRPTALATAWDIATGIAMGVCIVVRHRLGIVHARSYVPSVMALVIKRLTGCKYVFDMRGFWADERIDGNLWPADGSMYRVAKWFEKRFLLTADHVVSLTHAAIAEIRRFPYLQQQMPPTTVIPTCADLSRFKPASGPSEPRTFVLGYVGSVGTWYMFDEVAACCAELLSVNRDARLLIVNRGEHEYIRERLDRAGIPGSSVELVTANHTEMPSLIRRMDAGIFFIRPAFSKQASAPTKLAEFLGCGLPCLTNAGVGDMAMLLEETRTGVAITSFDRRALAAGVSDLMSIASDASTAARCVATAREHFSLESGVARYQEIYEHIWD